MLYEYKCKECGKKFEKLVKADEVIKCECGGDVGKLVSTFSFSCPVDCKNCKGGLQ